MTADLHTILLELTHRLLAGGDRYVVDIEVKGTAGSPMIWIYIESEKGGVGIDEYAKLSREILFHLESVPGVPDKFTLNVSSPGLDRPLTDIRQFRSNIGRTVSAKRKLDGTVQTFKGQLTATEGDRFQITDEKGQAQWFDHDGSIDIKIIPVFK